MNPIFKTVAYSSALLLGIGSLVSCGSKTQKPNVILILVDDAGYGDMSGHGNPYVNTPETDKLARDGFEFTNFHVDPTSSPTRAALMTGRYSSRTGVWLTYGSRHHLRRGEVTAANIFKDNGYNTAVFGKWHLGDNYPFRPNDRGFDESLIHGGGVVSETPDYWDNCNIDDVYFRNGEPEQQKGYCTDIWFDEAIKFIDKSEDKPFFVYIPTNAAHGPRIVTEDYAAPYADKPRADFYGMINSVDVNLGKLREHLESKKIADNTIIIFMTDNGTAVGAKFEKDGVEDSNGWEVDGFNAGLRGKKTSAYEGGHRATCIFYWKDGELTMGKRSDALSANIDIVPTLIDLCDLKEGYSDLVFDGVTLSPAFYSNGEELAGRTVCVHNQGRFGTDMGLGRLIKDYDYAVMQDKWRLVGDELYDLSVDFRQKYDVAEKHPMKVKELREEYEKWFASISKGQQKIEPFGINPEKQEVVTITTQNLLDGNVQYGQPAVRIGAIATGWTMIDVEKEGDYVISLRRWAEECDCAFGDIPSHRTVPETIFRSKSYNNKLSTLKRIDVDRVRLEVGNQSFEVDVEDSAKKVDFNVALPLGEQKIKATFIMADGSERAAYYIYIREA